MHLADCFTQFSIYEAIGLHIHPVHRLQLLLRLRLVNKQFKNVVQNWDLWWTWWQMETEYIDDAICPLHRFMSRLAVSYVNDAGNAVVDSLMSYRNFGLPRIRKLRRAVQGHTFYRFVAFRRTPAHFFCTFFIHLRDQMLQLHPIPPYVPIIRKQKINNGFLCEEQKKNVLRIFRFCKKLISRITRHVSVSQHDKQRFTCALKFLEKAAVVNN